MARTPAAPDPKAGDPKADDDPRRVVTPERDRRRDPRTDPSVLDLGSAIEGHGDWTAVVAPDLAPRQDRPADSGAHSDRVMTGDDTE